MQIFVPEYRKQKSSEGKILLQNLKQIWNYLI